MDGELSYLAVAVVAMVVVSVMVDLKLKCYDYGETGHFAHECHLQIGSGWSPRGVHGMVCASGDLHDGGCFFFLEVSVRWSFVLHLRSWL
jgi:hypothetical protein